MKKLLFILLFPFCGFTQKFTVGVMYSPEQFYKAEGTIVLNDSLFIMDIVGQKGEIPIRKVSENVFKVVSEIGDADVYYTVLSGKVLKFDYTHVITYSAFYHGTRTVISYYCILDEKAQN